MKTKILLFSFFCGLLLLGCGGEPKAEKSIDLGAIEKRGELIMLTENSPLSYFNFKDEDLGFEYEILDTFARSIGLKLKVKVVNESDKLVDYLRQGEGDIMAANCVMTLQAQKTFNFSCPFYTTRQVLIQRNEVDSLLVKDLAKLAHKTIHIRKGGVFESRLRQLSDEIGSKVYCSFLNGDPTSEDLIEKVANKKINFTVATENQAKISKELFPELNIKTYISSNQNIGFAMRFNSPNLKKKLDKFLSSYLKTESFKLLKKKYFDYIILNEGVVSKIPEIKNGSISPFDEYFKSAAAKYGWDWKLLAAVAYKESKFNPNASGAGGAYGMMQFMPNTGPSFGVYPSSPPQTQILGAMKLLNGIYNLWSKVPDKEQRIKFTLASYNAGKAHIVDAQNLATKYGLNPNVWDDNVEVMVKNLSDAKYYRDPLVRYGAYRGPASKYADHVIEIFYAWSGNNE